MVNRVLDQKIIEEIQTDEMGIERIGNRRYSYMMAAYELGNLGGTLGSRGELGYIKRGYFPNNKLLLEQELFILHSIFVCNHLIFSKFGWTLCVCGVIYYYVDAQRRGSHCP